MNIGARQTLLNDNNKIPYIDFNLDGTYYKSTYFKTGYIINQNTTVETCFGKLYLTSYPIGNGHQHGCRTGWVSKALQTMVTYANSTSENSIRVWPAFNSDSSFDSIEFNFNNNQIIIKLQNDGKLFINGNLEHNYNQMFQGNNLEYYIGDVNENNKPLGSSNSQGIARWHWTKIYENNNLVKHFIPVMLNNEISVLEQISNITISQSYCNGGIPIIYGEL